MYFSPDEISYVEETKFTKQCTTYFEKNFQKLAEDKPLFIPWKIPGGYTEIERIVDNWCKKTNKLSSIKGLILHSFPFTKCLELYGIKEDTLRDYLHIKKFSKEPITVVYNPNQRAILLVRKGESKDLATDMTLSLNDMKMFILLFNDELMESGMKLVPLVVSDGNPTVDCDKCLNHVLSEKKFETFTSLWEKYFRTKSQGKTKKSFINDFLAKATSFVAVTCIYHDCIPKFTSKTCEEMESLAVLLTREQMKIFYSQDKHMIVKGGFGCGKTIVAAAILQKISENLGEHEKLFYVCFDSRSALINHMIKDEQESEVAKVEGIHNKKRLHLSQIINDILEKEKHSEKVNFIVDEYDGEDLDESEANALNNMFSNTDSLKEAFIMLIVQPIEKERSLNGMKRQRNMFHLLKTMKTHQLTLVMRNSTEIHELVAAAKKVLSEEETVFIHQDDTKADRQEKISQVKDSKKDGKEIELISERPLNEVTSRQKTQQANTEETPKLGIDEAQAITGSLAEISNDGSKTVTKFTYAAANETGHNINSKRPALFELEERSEFQKILSLIAIFEKLDIRNKRHVLLHFDTANEIPSTLQFIFKHHFAINENVTNNYQESVLSNKSILVCSYLMFRGLEHPKITVFIDRNIYFLQHYLVESLARCTSKLNVVVLKNSETIIKVTDQWKNNQLVNQWKTICKNDTQRKKIIFKKQKKEKVITVTYQVEYYGKLEEKFNGLSTSKDETKESKMKPIAKIVLEQNR